MSDGLRITVDSTPLVAALDALPDATKKYTHEACRITAHNIQAEAKRRVARRTGTTAENIVVDELLNGNGFRVRTADVRSDAGQMIPSTLARHRLRKATVMRAAPKYYEGEHVGLWLEAGTRSSARRPGHRGMEARPFFYPAAAVELGAHARRIDEAIAKAIAEAFK